MIERIVVDNFKSIQHADVKLQKVNLLIGPNNSGKSNFLRVFEVIGENTNEAGDVKEFNFITREGAKSNIKISLFEGDIFLNGNRSLHDKFLTAKITNTDFVYDFFRLLKGSKVYKILVDKVKQPNSLSLQANSVSKDGDNVAAFLQIALNRYRNVFNRITKDLNDLTKEFKEVVLDIVPGTMVKFGLRGLMDDIFWSEELSDGVLYFLTILCIIYQPYPPRILLFEEPETGIHPRRIKEVIDLIKGLASEKDIQVIMTTHSPLVVDLFQDTPECIHVFEMKDGFTEIKNLKSDIIDPINNELTDEGLEPNKDYETTLGQQWVYGFLGGVPA